MKVGFTQRVVNRVQQATANTITTLVKPIVIKAPRNEPIKYKKGVIDSIYTLQNRIMDHIENFMDKVFDKFTPKK